MQWVLLSGGVYYTGQLQLRWGIVGASSRLNVVDHNVFEFGNSGK